jgi:hypothetical protein
MNEYWVAVSKAEGAKCPRCWRVTGEGRYNFDGLCDRCCDVLVTDHPTHPAIPHILAAYANQRARWFPAATPPSASGPPPSRPGTSAASPPPHEGTHA